MKSSARRRRGRVVEVGESLSGAYAGLILAALGWDVCQICLPDRRLSALESAFYDRGRSQVTTDESGIRSLVQRADLLLTDVTRPRLSELRLPLDEQTLEAYRPGLVQVSVTPFGMWGPRAGAAATEITEWAAGGLAYPTRRPVPEDDMARYTPVLPPGRQTEVLGGVAAAIGALAGFRLGQASGRAVLVDVSRQEVMASMAHHHFPILLYNQMVFGDPTHRFQYGYLLATADGDVYLRTVETDQWDRLAEWMGSPDWAVRADALPIYYTQPEVVGPLLTAWTEQFTRADLLAGALERRIPFAHPRDLDEVLQWDHLAATGVWSVVPDDAGKPVTAPKVPVAERGPIAPSVAVSRTAVEARWSGY